jgi:hypothetical protein
LIPPPQGCVQGHIPRKERTQSAKALVLGGVETKGGQVTSDVSQEVGGRNDLPEGRDERLAGRIAELYATDPQFRAAEPNRDVIEAARRPGLRLAEILKTLAEGYGNRPALGERAREFRTDPVTGGTSARLLPRFETISYRDVWARVRAIATAWRNDPDHPVSPGDFVATVGFASPEYLIVDLACAYLGLVSVPLQHNARRLKFGMWCSAAVCSTGSSELRRWPPRCRCSSTPCWTCTSATATA